MAQSKTFKEATNLMLVEDDDAIRGLVEMMCELSGLKVMAFNDGFQAMEYLNKESIKPPLPEIALLDIRMPGPRGHEISARIRQHPQLQNIGIIMMTAYELGGQDQEKYLQESGADRLLFKPLPPTEDLLSNIREVIQARASKPKKKVDPPNGSSTINSLRRDSSERGVKVEAKLAQGASSASVHPIKAAHRWRLHFEVLTAHPPQSFDLDIRRKVILGRGESSSVFVDLTHYHAEDLGVSRNHLQIVPDEDKLLVTDLRSRYGTLCNGSPVTSPSGCILQDGDVLQLGKLSLRVTILKTPAELTDSIVEPVGLTTAQIQPYGSAIRATLEMLSQPLMIVDKDGNLVVSNRAAEQLWDSVRRYAEKSRESSAITSLSAFLDSLSQNVGRVAEIELADRIYVATIEHTPDQGTIIVMQDATAIRQIERMQIEFAQALSHDIRGPLGSIIGYARMLGHNDLASGEKTEYLDEILRAANRVNEMAGHLLDFALMGRPANIAKDKLDLREAVTDAINDLKGAALAKSIRVDFKVGGKPYTIQGDISRLYRSILNLIDNAIKYSPRNTKISVKLDYSSERIMLVVSDLGPGIPDDELPRVFDKYYQVNERDARRTGIGLGLAMVRSTVQGHGGEIFAKNRDQGGTEFIITLPGSLRLRPH